MIYQCIHPHVFYCWGAFLNVLDAIFMLYSISGICLYAWLNYTGYFIWISGFSKNSLRTLFMMLNIINSNINIMSYESGP